MIAHQPISERAFVPRAPSTLHLLAILIVALCLAAVSHPVQAADTLTIMPLGDSITEGWPATDIAGYRGPLCAKLAAAGYEVHVVGSNGSFPGTLPPPQIHHEGHSGWLIATGMAGTERRDGLVDHIAEWLGPKGADPNVILLMIGTNDVWWNNELDKASSRLSGLISQISNKTTGLKPNAKLIVALIPPFKNDSQNTMAQAYNSGVASVVADHSKSGENVSLVDMHSALNRETDLADGVHPNVSGYEKIADVWFQGIKAAISSSAERAR